MPARVVAPKYFRVVRDAIDMSHSSAGTRTAGKGRGRRTAKIASFQRALQVAILAIVVVAAGRADAADHRENPSTASPPRYGTAKTVTGHRGKAIEGFYPSRG